MKFLITLLRLERCDRANAFASIALCATLADIIDGGITILVQTQNSEFIA
jgi:hypothetical protein